MIWLWPGMHGSSRQLLLFQYCWASLLTWLCSVHQMWGMSWSKDMVKFICHPAGHRVSMYCYIAVCMGLSTGLQGECSCNVLASCCIFSVRCTISSMCAGRLVVGTSWLSLSWSCWKCSCNSARSLWGLVSTLYPVAFSLSRSGLLWVVGVVSRWVVSWRAGVSSVSSYRQLDPHILLSCCEFLTFPVIVEQGFGRWLSTVIGQLHVGLCLCWEWGKRKHLPGKGCGDYCERLFKCCHWILSVDGRWALDWSIYHAGIINCSTMKFLFMTPV